MTEVAVIGAGSAGLLAAQALADRGVSFTGFEAGSDVGGNWRYENDSGLSSGYASLRTNTSRQRLRLRSRPLPRRGSLFLHHTEMLRYLEEYADHFDLRRHIRFGTRVHKARPLDDGGWEVEGERFGALVVATGYNNVPYYPPLPGEWGRRALHTHDYRTPDAFAGEDVVVIGLGCSACELASEVAGVARSVTVATRSGNWILPRRLGPMPLDWLDTRAGARVPFRHRRRTFAPLFRRTIGDLGGTGLQDPPLPVGAKPLAIADDFLRLARTGKIEIAPAVVELRGDRVVLADGSERHPGVLLYGTGYRASFPFLPPEADPPTMERAALYRGVTSLAVPNLHFVGLVFAHGALMPVMEAQAAWVADVVAGRLVLPSPEVMSESVARDAAVRRRDFEERFGFIWDRWAYLRSLERESRLAQRRPMRVSRRASRATVR